MALILAPLVLLFRGPFSRHIAPTKTIDVENSDTNFNVAPPTVRLDPTMDESVFDGDILVDQGDHVEHLPDDEPGLVEKTTSEP